MTELFSTRCRPLLLILLIVVPVGCGGSSHTKYIPAADAAKQALQTSLEKWKSGDAYGPITGGEVDIDFQDARWQTKKKLESYEILGEEKSGGPKVYNVKMKLDEDKEEKEVKYYVFGVDPLHVFRDKDYDKATGMGS
jgi:hypothetical protein